MYICVCMHSRFYDAIRPEVLGFGRPPAPEPHASQRGAVGADDSATGRGARRVARGPGAGPSGLIEKCLGEASPFFPFLGWFPILFRNPNLFRKSKQGKRIRRPSRVRFPILGKRRSFQKPDPFPLMVPEKNRIRENNREPTPKKGLPKNKTPILGVDSF